jgi:predicted component of type VI protein secretion system
MTDTSSFQIKLRRKGGVGPNTNWHWEVQDTDGNVVKSGSAVGEEHKAFATARVAKEKLEAGK